MLDPDDECADCHEPLSDPTVHCTHCGDHVDGEGVCQHCGQEAPTTRTTIVAGDPR